jgi:peptidoglycan/LPS O-acetylase OafA/YrhL
MVPSERVQAVRGFVALLLVAFHAVGTSVDTATDVTGASALIFLTKFFAYVRMPVFAFIAGFVYAMKPVVAGARADFAKRKLLRLFVPTAIATTVTYVLLLLGQSGHSTAVPLHDAWRIYVYPTYQFWFIQALLVVFVAVVVLESMRALSTPGRFAVTLAAAAALYLFFPDPETSVFSLPQAEYLFPFFLLGLAANRFQATLLTRPILMASLVLLFSGLSIQATSMLHDELYKPERATLLCLAVGMSGALCAIRWMPPVLLLRRLGTYSFAVYLYHYVFIHVFAHYCKIADFRAMLPLALVLTGVGVLGPIAFQRSVEWNQWMRTFVLGMRTLPPRPAPLQSGLPNTA